MRMTFGLSAFERDRGDLVQLPVVNMFAEAAASEKDGVVLQSRSGLEEVSDYGAAIDANFRKDGVLGGSRFVVAGGSLYRAGVSLGAINGAGPFSADGYENFLFTAGGSSLWGYDGTTLAAITFPDSASVSKVLVGASRVVCLRADTQRFYWSGALASTIDALSFATAESQPDRLRDMLFIDDTLVLFGAETVEFWPNTGDSNLPFQPLEGRVFERGVRETGAAAVFNGSFAWVGDDHNVYLNGQQPEPISNEGLQEKIEASTVARLWTFPIDGVEFLCLRLDTKSYVFSSRSRMWAEFKSYGETNWLPQNFANGQFGTSDGLLARFTSGHTDFGGVMERRFRFGETLDSGSVVLSNLGLRLNAGQTPYLTGTYADAVVEVRLSRDGGNTWGNWKSAPLGRQGKYRQKVQWAALGMFGQPGILGEFRVTDPVPFRVSAVLGNEPFGGF